MSAQEQAALRDQLVREYGLHAFAVACQLAGVKNALSGILESDAALTLEERTEIYEAASLHLALLMQLLMPDPELSKHVAACAARLDSAVDQWTIDDIVEKKLEK